MYKSKLINIYLKLCDGELYVWQIVDQFHLFDIIWITKIKYNDDDVFLSF